MKPPLENTYWVLPGTFLAGEYPGHWDAEKAKERIDDLEETGVNLFVDLTEEHELNPYTQWIGEAEHVRMPIRDQSIPTIDHMVKILDLLDRSFAQGKLPYVHCWGGIGRTGTVVGCWLARHQPSPPVSSSFGGTSGGEAGLAELKRLWERCAKSAFRNSPETREQERFILDWRAGQ